jgi:hypothetical protein
LTETWLSDEIGSGLIHVDNYNLVRNDRKERRGGGTAMYIRDSFYYEVIGIDGRLSSEVEGTFVDFPQLQLSVLCLYLPPQLNAATLQQVRDSIDDIIDDLLMKYQGRHIIILGDFNAFDVSGLCSDLNLIDIVDKPTRMSKILDHILVDEGLKEVYDSSVLSIESPIGKSDHATLIAAPLSGFTNFGSCKYHRVFDFRQSNMDKMTEMAKNIDWKNTFALTDDIDQQWSKLQIQITSILNDCIPQKVVQITDRDKPWMTPITKLALNQKWEAFRQKNWELFSKMKIKANTEIEKAKRIWSQKLKEKPDGLWKLTNALNGKASSNGLDSLISEFQSSQHLAEEIALRLSSPSLATEASSVSFDADTEDGEWITDISIHVVERHLQSLKTTKPPGVDGIPNRVYKCLATFLALPLKSIFETSIRKKVFPKEWKKGIVVPIPKTRPPQVDKLRLITLLPAPAKILEKIILKSQIRHLEILFGKQQHAYRKSGSTTTALVDIMDAITTFYDDKTVVGVGVLSLDFSRAFDKVDHGTLLRKTLRLSALTGFTKWLRNYLSERHFAVRINGQFSNTHALSVGVPQGSILGPSLFSVLVGDFPKCRQDNVVIQYADDVNIILPFMERSSEKIARIISQELTQVEQWCRENYQILNVDKTKMMLVLRRPFTEELTLPVRRDKRMKVLGVYLSDKLNWNAHVEDVTKRASQRLHILRTLKPHTTCMELHDIYNGSIGSLFEYCCPVFGKLPDNQRRLIGKVERRAHRIMFGAHNMCNCPLDGYATRQRDLGMKLFIKALNDQSHTLHSKMPHHMTHSNYLSNFVCRTNKRQNTFFPYYTLKYNSEISSRSDHVT